MRKGIAVITGVIVLTVSGLAFAQMQDKGKEMMGNNMMGMMGDKGMMGMCPMMGGMMSSMMGKSMVATSDGGVVVFAGNKLTKYDKDLNVAKEVEVNMDMQGMQRNMMEMMKNCPMMGGGMMGNVNKDAGSASEKSVPAQEVDHASHH